MTVGLFIPCYIDQFYPQVAIATLNLLEKLGLIVEVPLNVTCCGQPMANSGYQHLTVGCCELFGKSFAGYDYIVAPSGSCVLHLKEHLITTESSENRDHFQGRIYELTEFLTDVIKIKSLQSTFPFRVGLHQSCHGLRGLKLSKMSELVTPFYSKPLALLNMVGGIQLMGLNCEDECCGFGGTFCVAEEAVSVKMGKDLIKDHLQHEVEYVTSVDMSCLMHLDGILRRQNSKVKVIHIAEILNA